MSSQIRLTLEDHTMHDWKVHDLLSDFEVEDVWRFPVRLNSDHSLELFQEQMKKGMKELTEKGLAGALFRLRLFLGKVFKWDDDNEKIKKYSGTIRERYAKSEGLKEHELPELQNADFEPVYQLENESLSEIDNSTVHAALHLGRVQLDNGEFTVQMAVYVKPKGSLGRIYMQIIKLPRHWIVYPTMMKKVDKVWSNYLKSTQP